MFSTTYRNDRRKRRHRCRFCNRIIQPGERVIMWRPRGQRGYYAAHDDPCADEVQEPTSGVTGRELAAIHEKGD